MANPSPMTTKERFPLPQICKRCGKPLEEPYHLWIPARGFGSYRCVREQRSL